MRKLLLTLMFLAGCACQHEHYKGTSDADQKWIGASNIYLPVQSNPNVSERHIFSVGLINNWGKFRASEGVTTYWCDDCHQQVASFCETR